MDDFLTRAKAREDRKAPVRQAVERNWYRIEPEIAANVSMTNIYKELRLEGEAVGRSLSSFTNAIRQIKESRSASGSPQAAAVPGEAMPPANSPARFADDRFPQSEF